MQCKLSLTTDKTNLSKQNKLLTTDVAVVLGEQLGGLNSLKQQSQSSVKEPRCSGLKMQTSFFSEIIIIKKSGQKKKIMKLLAQKGVTKMLFYDTSSFVFPITTFH